MTRKGPEPQKVEDRFMAKVTETGGHWLWTGGAIDPAGYGRFGVKTGDKWRTVLAHRKAYELFVGPIPDGMTLDHLCRIRNCVNPAHLEPVDLAENIQRGDYRGGLASGWERRRSVTECPQGHPYDEANTYTHNGTRHCRECNRQTSRRRRAQRR